MIPPQFECPLPPLIPATFPPALREPPAPALDQFDLDEHFASPKIRLAQLTNKCTDDDIEYYVREAGEILGVVSELTKQLQQGGTPAEEALNGEMGAKRVLEYMFRQIVRYKCLNQEGGGQAAGGPSGQGGGMGKQVADSTGGGPDVLAF